MNEITLQLDGARIAMENLRHNPLARSITFDFTTTFLADTAARIPTRDCLMLLTDLAGMAAYIRKHVGENASHAIAESHAFVTYDLTFELQALEGTLESWDDGYFTMRWMFYCGPGDRSSAAFYVGLMGKVDVAEALRWCDALDELQR